MNCPICDKHIRTNDLIENGLTLALNKEGHAVGGALCPHCKNMFWVRQVVQLVPYNINRREGDTNHE